MQEDEQCGSKYTCHSDLCWIIALAEPFKLLLNRREDYQNFNNWDKNYLLKLTGKESIQLHILLSTNLIMILSLNYKSTSDLSLEIEGDLGPLLLPSPHRTMGLPWVPESHPVWPVCHGMALSPGVPLQCPTPLGRRSGCWAPPPWCTGRSCTKQPPPGPSPPPRTPAGPQEPQRSCHQPCPCGPALTVHAAILWWHCGVRVNLCITS